MIQKDHVKSSWLKMMKNKQKKTSFSSTFYQI